jgi:hypothetical protein
MMAESTSDDQGSEDAVKIDEQSGLGKSPIEQVWEAALGTSGGSRELVIEHTDVKEQAKTSDTLVEMMESGSNPEGSDTVDDSEVKDPSFDTEMEKTTLTLKEINEMLETAKDTLSEVQEKIQEATKEE